MKMVYNERSKQGGFTLIELLIATTVFALVLVVFLSAFLRISQMFYKGVSMAKTQEAARTVLAGISDDLQFSNGSLIKVAGANYFCTGVHRYTFNIGQQVGPGVSGIKREVMGGGGCPAPTVVSGSNPEELLDYGMQVNQLRVDCNNNLCTVDVRIVYYGNDPSVLIPNATDPNAKCSGADNSSQYCAIATYTSTILQKP